MTEETSASPTVPVRKPPLFGAAFLRRGSGPLPLKGPPVFPTAPLRPVEPGAAHRDQAASPAGRAGDPANVGRVGPGAPSSRPVFNVGRLAAPNVDRANRPNVDRKTSPAPSNVDRPRDAIATAPATPEKVTPSDRDSDEIVFGAPVPDTLRSISKAVGPDLNRVRALHAAAKRDLARSAGLDIDADENEGGERAPGTLPATIERYNYQGKILLRRYMREMAIPEEAAGNIDPENFVDWFMAQKSGFKPSTWRHYRRAVTSVVEVNPHDNRDTALARLTFDVDEIRSGDEYRGRKKAGAEDAGGSRAYREKIKFIPYDDYHRIISVCTSSLKSTKLDNDLRDWLRAGVKTGLRPTEWKATSLVTEPDDEAFLGRRCYLYVINAKATNGRGNGVVRTIDLTSLTDDDVAAISRHSGRAYTAYHKGTFEDWMKACSKLLERICDKCFRRRGEKRASKVYSLYALRHQFIANMKDAYPENPAWVSAMAGHSVVDTAKSHYAKRRSSWGPQQIGPLPRPVDEEVATVRRQEKMRERIRAIRNFQVPDEPSVAAEV